jgi:hypothetical protein
LTSSEAANSLATGGSPLASVQRNEFIRECVVSKRAISLTISIFVLLGSGVAIAQQPTARVVAVCAPPGGLFGRNGQYRMKIEKYADNTIVPMGQNFATNDPNRWAKSPAMPLTGGHYVSSIGQPMDVTAEGDGYKVASNFTSAHFSCVPVAAGTAPK